MSMRNREYVNLEPTYVHSVDHMPVPPYVAEHNTPIGNVGTVSMIADQNNGKNRSVLSPVSLTRWHRSITPGSITCVGSPPTWNTVADGDLIRYAGNSYPQDLPVDLKLMPVSSTILLIKALADIKQGAVMSGEILHDLGQTLGMLRRPLEGCRKLLSKILKSEERHLRRKAMTAARAAGNAWLEYRYGWRPLIMDCEKIVDEAMKFHGKLGAKVSVARAQSEVKNSESRSWAATAGNPCSGSFSLSERAKNSVGIRYAVAPRTPQEQLNAIFSTRASDLPATIWECIPYSFVIDWFANVGDWVQAIVPVPGLVLQGHWVTSLSESVLTMEGKSVSTTPNTWNGSFGAETVTQFRYNRVVNPPLPVTPELRWSSKPFNVQHQADGISLLLGPLNRGLQDYGRRRSGR